MKPLVLNGLVLLLCFCLFVCLFVFSIISALVLAEGTSKYVATICKMMKTLLLEKQLFLSVSQGIKIIISSKTVVSLPLTNLKLSLQFWNMHQPGTLSTSITDSTITITFYLALTTSLSLEFS